jgi:hypothetical protein
MVSCQLKAVKEVTSNKAIKHENLPIKAMQKVQDQDKGNHAEVITHSHLPLSPPVNKLSKAGLLAALI